MTQILHMDNIRNFCIIAHIDHGKSTLADRLLDVTHTVDKRDAQDQLLDQMDLERERGITIKLAPVSMKYSSGGKEYALHLIDTPGHVDFSYEVSRSLASVEGAILLVDATQGVEAQTLTNLYLALEHDLTVIPAINKIDLPSAQVPMVQRELMNLLGVKKEDILLVSGKTGQGVPELLDEVIKKIPPPKLSQSLGTRALVFDSLYDEYKGVIAYVRLFSGSIKKGDELILFQSTEKAEALEVGEFHPKLFPIPALHSGDIGYVVTGLRDVADIKVGDTITVASDPTATPLPGYKELQPMVFAGLYAKEGSEYAALREALERLKLNDASLQYEPDHSPALGFGFRCGFLGLLHLEVVSERLRREYDLDLVVTVPSVAYHVFLNEQGLRAWERKEKVNVSVFRDGFMTMSSALYLPDVSHIDHIEEPWVKLDIVTPKDSLGNVMELVASSKGVFNTTEFLDEERAIVKVEMPLASILIDFYDKLKSVTSGYASYHYDFLGYQIADVERLDILVAGELVDALASMVYRVDATRVGRAIVERLKDVLPRQLFEVKIQAAIGAKVLASSRIAPLRKDVTAKLYGGDVTRKRKLLEKQKKGKKRMRSQGRVDIPQSAYLAVLKR
ncbi:MAG: elongation factor 4 [Candidatus Kerfeldbacteria bacterium CG08_land_8_20_14_0_20_42_7]|uniref:Elongation factor 4 n=1 Tax=Candidatus Kerfeldbacteria bacterium CG08_land_8_20_14_0_20_42_7 TaxID=2014245 RepID=A0A2H0YVT6_9BACT|nr:MAG: elongation factor 4 [Candidatus Kerfeldbacteria bacterium CG08_land_8_20_14_0_20_42_7]